MGDTNISVSSEVWMELNSRKQPGDTFDDVLRRVLEMDGDDEADAAIGSPAPEPSSTERPPLPDDLPNTVDPEAARAAIAAAVAVVRAEGAAPKREIVCTVLPEHPLTYDVPDLEDGRYRGAWWRRVIKPGLEAHADIEKPASNQSDWRWVG